MSDIIERPTAESDYTRQLAVGALAHLLRPTERLST
jgi:hypothetical protein